MNLTQSIALLLLAAWTAGPLTAGIPDFTGINPMLGYASAKKNKKAKKGTSKSEQNEEEEREKDEEENDPILGKHPIPKYTDFSQLNASPKNLEKNYRLRVIKAYRPNRDLNSKLKISNYSSYENPTGIIFNAGEKFSIRMEGSPRTQVEFVLRDFGPQGRHTSFPLKKGINNFTAGHFGHGYINYRDSEPDSAPAIKVQIKGGTINGVFTQHDCEKVWRYLLKNAKSDLLDIIGERCQWVLDLKALRASCPTQGPELVKLYDEEIKLEQQLMGWDWEGIHPGNHIMGRVMWQGYMHADGLGGAYHCDTTPGLVNVEGVRKSGAWGTAHEFGHVNQTRPGLKWVGTTEVTVNIFSALVNYTFNPNEVRLEHERCSSLEGIGVRGGRFDCYVNSALVNRELWQFHRGPDNGNLPPGVRCGDHFVTLCPMWQMYLYNTVARGDKLFYPRIFKDVRDTDESRMKQGELRMKYLERCCNSAELDFSDYFLATGMLAPMSRLVDDYGKAWLTITEDMCIDLLKKTAKYPKPESPVVFYINANNVEIYKEKLDIVPSPRFQAELRNPQRPSFVVPADQWENAVAFEVYDKEDKLIRICLRGLNQMDNKSTEVFLPPTAEYVMAVQWDGKRFIMQRKSGRSGIDARPDPCTGPGQYREVASTSKKKRKKR